MKCKVCGKRFKLLAQNRYEVVVRPEGALGVLTASVKHFNAFDCPHCGCQNIVSQLEKEKV